MTKNDLQKLIKEIVKKEIKAIAPTMAYDITTEVKDDIIKEVKAEMFDLLTSNRLPQPTPMTENTTVQPQPNGNSRSDLRAIFEQANPMYNMGMEATVDGMPPTVGPVINSVADLPPTAEVVTSAGVELYKKLLSGGK